MSAENTHTIDCECGELRHAKKLRCDPCEDRHSEMRDAGVLAYALGRLGVSYVAPARLTEQDDESYEYGVDCASCDESLCEEAVEAWMRGGAAA